MLQGTPSTDQAAPPSIAFTWAAPSVTNGDILDYQVTCTSAAGLPNAVVTSSTISATLSNLENGARYCCTVTARNAQGSSVPSDAHCTSTVEIGMHLQTLMYLRKLRKAILILCIHLLWAHKKENCVS